MEKKRQPKSKRELNKWQMTNAPELFSKRLKTKAVPTVANATNFLFRNRTILSSPTPSLLQSFVLFTSLFFLVIVIVLCYLYFSFFRWFFTCVLFLCVTHTRCWWFWMRRGWKTEHNLRLIFIAVWQTYLGIWFGFRIKRKVFF